MRNSLLFNKPQKVIFDRRYKVLKKLTKGSFGQVYEAIDMQNNDKPVICKINDVKEMNELEGSVLKLLNQKGFKNYPILLGMGVQKSSSYQILERLGNTLEYH